MKNEKFMRSVGEIGDDLLQEAAGYKAESKTETKIPAPRGKLFRRVGLIAAVLAVVIAAAFVIPALFRQPNHVKIEIPSDTGIILNSGAYSTDAGADLPDSLKQIEVLANGSGEKLMATDSTLVVKTAAECDTETFVKYVSVTPELPMAVTKVSATEFHLKPAQTAFAPNTLYRVTVGDPQNPAASFAFQTVSELAIKNILPGAGSTGVPVNTGIEVTFTDSVKNTDFSEYITLTPAVSGRFILYPNGKTVAFVPEDGLEYDSVYTVTVKEGLESISGKPLAQGRAAVFRTEGPDEDAQFVSRINASVNGSRKAMFTPADPYSLGSYVEYAAEVYYNGIDRTLTEIPAGKITLTATFYRAVSWDSVAEAVTQLLSSDFAADYDEDALLGKYFQKVDEVKFEPKDGLYRYKCSYTPGKEGFYYTVITAKNNNKVYTFRDVFQISNLRLGGTAIDGKAVVVVSYDNGARVAGAEIKGLRFNANSFYESTKSPEPTAFKKTCGSDGTAVLEYGEGNALAFIYTDGERSALALKSVPGIDDNDYYINTLYTDRSVYFTDDVINVWGTLKGLYGAEVPKELYVFTGFSSVGTPVTVSEDGFFSASVKIENVMRTYTYVRVEDANGTILAGKSVSVTEEEKPVIKAEMSFEKPYYFYGDTAVATIKVTFYDGTPAEGYEVSAYCNEFENAGGKVTDENGCATFKIKTGSVNANSTYPWTVSAYAYISGEGVDTLRCAASFVYFHSDYVLAHEGRIITLNELDRSKCPEYVAGKPVTTKPGNVGAGSLEYALIQVKYNVYTYTEYDMYLKRSVERTRYEHIETCEEQGKLYFEDGRIELKKVDYDPEKYYYYYKLYFTDAHGRYEFTVPARDYDTSYYTRYYDYYDRAYSIVLDKDAYLPGDAVNAKFIYGETNNCPEPVLIFTGKSYISHSSGSEGAELFTEERLPEMRVTALYFDEGRKLWRTSYTTASYDYESAVDGEISVKTDKDVYKPGDTATVTVYAPQLAGGKALISIVDEACFALGENAYSLLGYLKSSGYFASQTYMYRDYNYYYSYYGYFQGNHTGGRITSFSDIPLSRLIGAGLERNSGGVYYDGKGYEYAYEAIGVPDFEAEAPGDAVNSGGEKTYYVRENFADNPVFAQLDFDENGTATLVFKVPDNLTAWRVTALGIKNAEKFSDIRIAQSTGEPVCTLPFFVKTDVCSTYVKGDDIALSVRCFGSKAQGSANYTAVICDADGNEIARKQVSGDTKAFTGINFGKLDAGEYSLTVYADCGEYTDALKNTFNVVTSTLAVDAVATVTLDELKSLNTLAYPVNVVVSAGGSDSFYSGVLGRLYYSYGERADSLAAKYAAAVIMKNVYGGDFGIENITGKFDSFCGTAGVKLLPYGEADLELTALIADVAPELLAGKIVAANLFANTLNKNVFQSDVELCAAIYGLAACGEPVLDVLYTVSSQAGDYSDEAKLYLACGFAAAGDYTAAESIYSQTVGRLAVSVENATYLNAADEDSKIKLTSLALVVASRIRRSDAIRYARYAVNIPNTHGEAAHLGLAAFAKYYLPAEKQELQNISYTLADGVKRESAIGFGKQLCLTLYKSDLESLVLEGCENAAITVRYSASAAEAARDYRKGRVKVQKTISGDVVTITVSGTSNRYWEYFSLDDVIPSGARLLYTFNHGDYARGSNATAYIYNRAGQRMEGHISVSAPESYFKNYGKDNTEFCKEYSFSVTVSYRIRKAVSGEFVVEPAAVSSEYSEVFEFSTGNTTVVYD